MAKKRQSFSGKIGPTVTYELNGVEIVRSLPRRYEQTPATKARGLNFGRAAKIGAQIRAGLKDVIPFPKDQKMRGRLAGSISKWLTTTPPKEMTSVKQIPYLSDIHFNQESELRSKWKSMLHVDISEQGELVLNIPAFVPAEAFNNAPAWTETIECRIGAVSCTLLDYQIQGEFHTGLRFSFDRNEVAPQEIALPVPVESGHIVLVAMSMTYILNKQGKISEKTEPAFRPSDVIAAMYC